MAPVMLLSIVPSSHRPIAVVHWLRGKSCTIATSEGTGRGRKVSPRVLDRRTSPTGRPVVWCSVGARRSPLPPAKSPTHAEGEVAELDPAEAHLVRVVEYDVPDRAGNGTSELIVLLSTILTRSRPVPMNSPPTTSAGRRRPPTTSSRPTYAAPGKSCARGYPSWCIRRSGPG